MVKKKRNHVISTKERYTICIVADLAEQKKDGHVPLKDIVERLGSSKKYFEIHCKRTCKRKNGNRARRV